ncbi:MAG: O-succinylhomoserine sulfhydrylase [Halofilum sp. (in: g-proteobacteria)]|nr:O-succinylhomoserine sulfhydrylase [Halofilum sp. (in: g-proteobacteria)]
MEHPDWAEYALSTRAIRVGHQRTHEQEHSEPIFATSSFCFGSAREAAESFTGNRAGNVYSRFTNPTVRAFQQRLAAMEGGEECIATASGMVAILSTCLSLLQTGDHIVSSTGVFGSTTMLFDNYLARLGIQTTWVPPNDPQRWREAVRPETRLFYLETPTNPLTEIADIEAIAGIAHDADALLVVDNCFCTPVQQQPLALGADIVIHSATKYLDGQGRCLGGAIVGDAETVGEKVFGFLRTAGPSMSPFNAWVFLKGLETLSLRMQAHSQAAMLLAEWLAEHPQVERVYYPGLPSHPQHELAKRQQTAFGGIVSFEVAGGQPAAWELIDSTRMLSITANLGDTKTTITHPASTTHGRLTPEQRAAAGIGDGLVRVAAGLEAVDDIRADLQRGLDRIG